MSYTRQVVTLLSALALTACGGGGGSGGAASVSGPAAPAASSASAAGSGLPPAGATCTPGDAPQLRSATFTLINLTRETLGLPTLARVPAFDTTAQAHARYAVANNSTAQEELQGQPCYTGADLAQRLAGAGVVQLEQPGRRALGEILLGYTTTAAEPQAWDYVNDMLGALYSRIFLLDPRLQQLGVGASGSAGQLRMLVLDTALQQGATGTSSDSWVVWPRDGATGLPTRMRATELRPLELVTEGYPVTLHAAAALQVTRFVLSTAADGAMVAASVVTRANDGKAFLAEGEAALLPHAPLAAGTTYRAEFDGSVGSTPVHLAWSFTTAP